MHLTTETTMDDVFFVARRVLSMLKDPRTNAERLGRAIDLVPALGDAVGSAADALYRGRGRVVSTSHAITLVGFDRLERLVRGFIQAEFARQLALANAQPPAAAAQSEPDRPTLRLVAPVARYAAL